MILTDNARQHFEIWYTATQCNKEKRNGASNRQLLRWLYDDGQGIILNSFIIEWFDSIGIYIFIDNVKAYKERFWRFHIAMNDLDRNIREEFYMNNRSEITYKAIKEANKIYNAKFEKAEGEKLS
ncbi:hypothetical protein [Soonwooa purpurea]